jgi:Protein of unknown function (DUF3307)
MVLEIALMGGIFAVLAFIHFFVDWIFQSHSEAMVKHNNPKIRAKHCLIYTVGFLPLLLLCNFSWMEMLVAANILFWSHFCEDTYIPVFLWAKYIRRPPEMTEPRKQVGVDGYVTVLPPDAKAGFADWVQTAMGKILMIAIDQIIHLFFLFPIAWMILWHIADDLH